MNNKLFHLPITLFSGSPGSFRLVTSVKEAGDFLFDGWAAHDSEKWSRAMLRCDAALQGNGKIDEARAAFVEAIREAGIIANSSQTG